jgi:hypothetical protein
MGYIPPGAEWYLAEIVEEFRIAGESENIVHTNLVLVRADSPDELEKWVSSKEELGVFGKYPADGQHA